MLNLDVHHNMKSQWKLFCIGLDLNPKQMPGSMLEQTVGCPVETVKRGSGESPGYLRYDC